MIRRKKSIAALFLLLCGAAVFLILNTPSPTDLSSFPFDPSSPLAARVAPMPDWLLKIWRKLDDEPSYKAYQPSAEEIKTLSDVIDSLPPGFKKVLEARLIAVYFVSNLEGNGLTQWVVDSDDALYAYMLLNPAAFRVTLSEALSARERSVFKNASQLQVDVGPGGSGVVYSFLHEAAHAFDIASGLSPFPDPSFDAFFELGNNTPWDGWESYDRPLAENDFPERTRLKFYGIAAPELSFSEAPSLYTGLLRSPFASLYGSKNWADDAAELFVFQHLSKELRRPYRINFPEARRVVEPFANPRVRARAEEILSSIYNSDPPLRERGKTVKILRL